MKNSHDAIIIGTGQAGPSLAKRLSEAGMSVAIIERHLFGGTCVNTGCIPTKALEHCVVYNGHARFQSAREVEVGGTVLRADRVFINVGGRHRRHRCPGSIASRSDPRRARRDVREGAVSCAAAGHAHSSHRLGVHSDAAWRTVTVRGTNVTRASTINGASA